MVRSIPEADGLRWATTVVPARIEACEAQSYHHSARIQAHGLLLVADAVTLRVVRVSANAGSILGLPIDGLFGTTILAMLAPASAAQVVAVVADFKLGGETRKRRSLVLDVTGARCFSAVAFMYRCGDGLIAIEIEPPMMPSATDAIAALASGFFELVDSVAASEGPSDRLADVVCGALQQLTGFDRIYFCHFDAVGHGHVLGESNNGVLSSLRDHHFPATDIPFAARQIMLVNPFRLIPDVDAPDVAILGGDGLPLDLTFSACRAIADSHLRYLRNMGATASLSFSVVADGGLEALFGGHHHTARRVPIHRMAACRHLVELFRARYEALRMREDRAFMARYTRAAHELAADFIQTDCDPVSFVAEADHAFRDLMDADDVLCRFDRQDHFGRLLPPSQACAVLDFVSQRIAGGIGLFRSDSLMTECTDFGLLCPAVAGALAVSLGLSGNNIVVWLRSEAKVNQTWAGDPHQPVQMDGTGGMEPRGSFLAYVRQTARSCRPWSPASAELARQFRYIFSQALARHYETRMRKGAEQATALKTEFIANVSHELRSPMHSIIGFSEMLAEDGDILSKEKRQRFLRTIIDSSRRLLHLIDDLLDLSSLHAGKMIFHPRVGDILPTIERAVAEVDGLARPKQIEITILRDGNRRPVSFDPVRIEQVIINLLSNALKFSPPRSAITIDVSTSHAGRDLPGLIIEVSDQGVGIPTIELDLIFEKFMQSSRTRSGAGGTGLGLAICREIIEAHGGRIWAVNNPSGGTSLFVALPHAPPEGIPA